MNYRIFILFIFCLSSTFSAHAQFPEDEKYPEQGLRKGILDDTTKLIYDYSTVIYIKEKNIKYNYKAHYELDTSLYNLEKWSTMARHDYKLQNLGNQGTATKSIYYQMPREIGRTSGFSAYDVYYKYPDQIKYYNSKSTFTNLQVALASNDRATLDVDYSRNINPGWNVGFDFNTQDIDKLLNRATRNDTHVKSTQFDIYSWYRSKNNRYNFLSYFNRLEHNVNEQGGVIISKDDKEFEYQDASVYLANATAKDLRYTLHAYQEYKWYNALTFYHEFDFTSQRVNYLALENDQSRNLFPVFINKDTSEQTSEYAHLENQLGVKGFWRKWYYMLYAKHRKVDFSQSYVLGKKTEHEVYGGAYMRMDFDSLSNAYVAVSAELAVDGRHRLKGEFVSDYAELSYERTQYAPSYLNSQYYSNHLSWENSFLDQQADQLKGRLKLRSGKWLEFEPNLTLTNLANYIYYDTDRKPKQSEGFTQLWSVATNLNFNFLKKMHFDNEFVYSFNSGGETDVVRVPKLFLNSKLYFQSPIYQNKLRIETGVNLRFISAYYADKYDPTTQQFYLSDKNPADDLAEVQGVPVLDAYFSFRIKSFSLFFNYINLTQSAGRGGYWTTPLYSGPPSGLDLGVRWEFFD